MKENSNKRPVFFAALNPYLETHIVHPTEVSMRGKDYIGWGENNNYPDYLLDLYNNVTTLHSIIDGTIDFIVGDDVTTENNLQGSAMNIKGDTIKDLVANCAKDFLLYGGFALQVVKGKDLQTISEVYYIDMRYLRSNKDNDVFYYCENWSAMSKKKILEYPKFMRDGQSPCSILFVKAIQTQTYPAPCFAASVKACEIERSADEYHLNAINNGFSSSAVVNFNNGMPEDPIKEEIEKDFNEKFCGQSNAGRAMLTWNDDKDHAVTISEMSITDFGERYKSLATHARQQVFTAFRAIPLLFGLTSEANTGFSTEEFEQSFKLYNRTRVKPAQRIIIDAFDKILGKTGSVTIKPFSLDGDDEGLVQ